jgi:hypothetical protein
MTREPDVGLEQPGHGLGGVSPAQQAGQSAHGAHQQVHAGPPPKRSSTWIFFLVITSLFGCFAALAGGFIYGEYYGRQHAQYDNPTLRSHYAGECFRYVSQEFTKTVRDTLATELGDRGMTRAAGAGATAYASPDQLQRIQEDLAALRQALGGDAGSGRSAGALLGEVKRLIRLLEDNQLQLVSDECPASSTVPKRYSSHSG